ncbi:HAMP domain-containing methyl-accepting chemotaxis protein [uncultured Hoeflea sp.]|uniref:methyl-accepting chemotaxis protein n=1 Tax=uncultured Hoeflea sp. TaxID=538666 RepID=UPI0030D7ED23
MMTFTLEKVKIEGPDYRQIIAGKDLVADIMSPPMFLIEAYLLASEIEIENTLAAENLPRIEQLQADYEDRLSVWRASNLPDNLKQIIETEITPAADSFWHDMHEEFIPAEASGDEQARSAAIMRMREDFETQKQAVETLFAAATRYLKNAETTAHDHTVLYSKIALSTAALAIVTLLGGLFLFRRRAISPLVGLSNYMAALAEGDLDTKVPFTNRQDEMGDMARSVAVFRQQGIEKIRAENENRQQSEQIEAEKAARHENQAREAKSLQAVVEQLGAGLERLSQFNIRETLDAPFEPKFEQLRHDFNKSLAAFQETMSKVLEKTREIQASADALQGSSDQLANRTEQQAAALEETAAALEQITINVKHSTERTSETRGKTRSARQNVETSTTVVQQAIDAMQRIEQTSGQIGNITNVIDEIAFQTNLLALNAGVEAARAGEAGKGFAVVAQEVRELAQRSANAAKEIKELIAHSGQEVSGGVDLVKRTGQALQEIEADITGIAGDVDAIALAANEQSTGLLEINQAINQMDTITQQNAAMVEETTAATHSLAGEVSILVQLVGQFVFNRRNRVRDTPEDMAKTLAMRGGTARSAKAA